MGFLDFFRTEKRESQPFTEAIQAAIFEQASGSAPFDAKALGALEVAAGFWARAFASAKITPENALTRALAPSILAMIGPGAMPQWRDGFQDCSFSLGEGSPSSRGELGY